MTDKSESGDALARAGKRGRGGETTAPRKLSRLEVDPHPSTGGGAFSDDVPDDDDNRTRGTKAYQLVRRAIATGTLKPGARVMESELAALLNMSRTPIREAIAA